MTLSKEGSESRVKLQEAAHISRFDKSLCMFKLPFKIHVLVQHWHPTSPSRHATPNPCQHRSGLAYTATSSSHARIVSRCQIINHTHFPFETTPQALLLWSGLKVGRQVTRIELLHCAKQIDEAFPGLPATPQLISPENKTIPGIPQYIAVT